VISRPQRSEEGTGTHAASPRDPGPSWLFVEGGGKARKARKGSHPILDSLGAIPSVTVPRTFRRVFCFSNLQTQTAAAYGPQVVEGPQTAADKTVPVPQTPTVTMTQPVENFL
jgi:hypothetical protein